MKVFLTLVAAILFSNFSVSQITINATGSVDTCATVPLEVVSPQAGWSVDWYVLSNACSGITQLPVGPLNSGTTFSADFTGRFYCLATDSLGVVTTSNYINVRSLPGSMNLTSLPGPYPSGIVNCQDSISLCVPTDFYSFFPTTIAWYKNNVQIPGASNPNYMASQAGWYKYSITSPCTTDFSDSIQITNPMPAPVITGNASICQGGSTILTVNGGYVSFLWSTGEITSSINVTIGSVYTVTVTGVNGCSASTSTTVSSNGPIPIISGDTSICIGDSTLLDAGGGYSGYFWSIGTFTQSVFVTNAGIYTVTVTDINGCTGTDSIIITASPLLTVGVLGSNIICQGDCSTLSVNVGYSSYLWSNGFTVNTVTVCTAGAYTISVSDVFGCTASATVIITVNPTPVPLITGDSTLCQSQTSILSAGNWTSYLWNTGAFTQSILITVFNIYTVTVTDLNGCTGTDNITVGSSPPYPVALSASGPLGICLGDSVQLYAPTPMIFYQWYKNNVAIAGATSSSIWANSGKYNCMSLDTSGCAANSNQVKVAVVCFPPPPPIDKLSQVSEITPEVIVFPNPNNGAFSIRFNREINEPFDITITDISGKIVQRHNFEKNEFQIDIQLLTSGYYLIELKSKNNFHLRKSVIIY